jgi:S-DNA-T family DNA segregation ATPase FtsK/SpoIIIE
VAKTQAARAGFLPRGSVDFLRRRLSQTGGFVLLCLGVALAAAIVSFNPGDPSLNTISGRPIENSLGAAGAILSDLLLQYFGVAALLPIAALVTWGGRLSLTGKLPPRPRLRFAALIAALPLAAMALIPLPLPGGEMLPAGSGGAVGLLALRAVAAPIGLGPVVPALAAGILAAGLALFALGLSLTEWKNVGRALVRAARAVDRAGTMLARLIPKTTDFPKTPPAPQPVRRRAAPKLDPYRAPDEDDDLVEPTILAREPDALPRDLVAPKAPRVVPGRREAAARQGSLDLPMPDSDSFELPPVSLLSLPPADGRPARIDEEALAGNAKLLETVLDDFGVNGKIVKVRPGPVVTLYELEPAPGTKTSRVIGLADDIARSMSALAVRIAVVPGRTVIGIELPNARRETVYLRELLASEAFDRAPSRLTLVLGKDIGGGPVMVDLARMPHLLIAGTTGSGKSVAINTMILSLLYRLKPEECRMIMIDPKMLELSVYDGIPHLLAPVVTEPGKAVVALKWAVREMEDRYRAMSQLGVRNIAGYNQRLAVAREKGERLTRTVQTGFDSDTGKPVYEDQDLNLEPLPFIVVIVDEMADLMLVAGKDIEAAVQRLAQMARAAGIHILMATQRPSVDVITGTIKANFPTRISFQVTSKIDSRTILGEQGAEQLLGQGDMLYMASGGRVTRVHGPFVSDQEVEMVVEHLRQQGEPSYVESVTEEEETAPFGESPASGGGGGGEEGLYDQAVALVAREGKASTSFIQRHLQIGYNRAARLIERMEAEGVVSRANHVGKREVLVRGHQD